MDVGAARIWLPELGTGDVGRGTGKIDKLQRDPVLITAFLARDPASLLTRLKCSNKDIERGRAIGQWRDRYPDPRHLPQVRKWLSGVRPGPEVGETLARLLAEVLEDPTRNTKQHLLSRV